MKNPKMSHLLTSSFIDIHDNTIPFDSFSANSDFGLLTLNFAKCEPTTEDTFILFTIDKTGSMLEQGRMDYVKQTFKNIIQFISKCESPVHIRVHAFNDSVQVLVDTIRVTSENADQIINAIANIEAERSTAIDLALTESASAMKSHSDENPGQAIFHIFMTDGEPTVGIKNHSNLAALVDPKFPAIFIGFGQQHNSALLRHLSASHLNRYDIVDNLEHTGVVYGNIMHEILYRSITDLSLTVENGKIYDWTTNQWTTNISDPSISGDSQKIYHLTTTSASELVVKIEGIPAGESSPVLLDTAFVIPDLEDIETGELQSSRTDLSKYMYRQSVQELMFESRFIGSKIQEFKARVSALFRSMRKFMRLNGLTTDRMMIQLCDDLYIMHSTIGTKDGLNITMARGQSQGRQQSNTVPLTPNRVRSPSFEDFDFAPPKRRRDASMSSITPISNDPDENDEMDTAFTFDSKDYDDDISRYELCDDPVSCFASPSAVNTMNSIVG